MNDKKNNIEEMIKASLSNVASMIDVSKVVGTPIYLGEGQTLIPITKVSVGFGAAGSEFPTKPANNHRYEAEASQELYPFGGGSGGGLSINPVAFLAIQNGNIRLISVEKEKVVFERLFDIASNLMKK